MTATGRLEPIVLYDIYPAVQTEPITPNQYSLELLKVVVQHGTMEKAPSGIVLARVCFVLSPRHYCVCRRRCRKLLNSWHEVDRDVARPSCLGGLVSPLYLITGLCGRKGGDPIIPFSDTLEYTDELLGAIRLIPCLRQRPC